MSRRLDEHAINLLITKETEAIAGFRKIRSRLLSRTRHAADPHGAYFAQERAYVRFYVGQARAFRRARQALERYGALMRLDDWQARSKAVSRKEAGCA